MVIEKAAGQRIGYKRVSTIIQSTERQLEGLTLNKVFEDKASGKDTKRPQLTLALSHLREGDTLVVHSMDRLSRSLTDLRLLVKELNDRGISVQFVKENLTFTGEDSPMANLLLNLLGSVAEFERALINERQREGIAIAKTKGNVYKGRRRALSATQASELRAKAAAGANKSKLATEFGISRMSLYAYLGNHGAIL